MTDLLHELTAAIETADQPRLTAGRDGEYAAAAGAGDALVEHMRFTVPWCIARLDYVARRSRLDYPDAVAAEIARQGRELGGMAGGTQPQESIASTIGALGDSLMGGSKPGRGAAVAMSLAWGLAAVTLLSDDGAHYRHLHWCHPAGCTCTRKEAACARHAPRDYGSRTWTSSAASRPPP